MAKLFNKADTSPNKMPKLRFKLKKRYIIAVTLLGVMGAGAVWGYRFLSGENQGKVQPPEVAAALAEVAPKAEEAPLVSLTTQYLLLKYEAVYGDVRNLGPEPNALERYLLIARQGSLGSKTIAVTIKNLVGGKVEEESAYDMRQNQPDVYKEISQSIAGKQMIFMQKVDGSEVTFFATHHNWLAIIALTTTGAGDNLMKEATTMAEKLEWRL